MGLFRLLMRDTAIYGVSSIISRSIAFLVLPIYTRFFTPTEYGFIDLLNIIGAFVTFIATLEITQAVARFFPQTSSHRRRRAIVSSAFLFALGGYGLFAVIALGIIWLQPGFYKSFAVTGRLATVMAVFSIVGMGLFYFLQSQLRWQLKAKEYAIVSTLVTAVTVALSLAATLVLHYRTAGVFGAQVVGYLIGCVGAWIYTRDLYRLHFNRRIVAELLRFSWPLVPASISIYISQFADRFSIEVLMGPNDLGIFSVGYRIASIAALITIGIQASLTPLIYTHYRNPDFGSNLRVFGLAYVLGSTLLLLSLGGFSHEIITIVSGARFWGASVVVTPLLLSILVSGATNLVPGLFIAKKTPIIAWLQVAAALVNLAFNFVLIPILGIAGAAMATAVSALSLFAGYAWFGRKDFPHTLPLMRCAGALAVGTAAALLLSQMHPAITFADAATKLLTGMMALAAILALLLDRQAVNVIVGLARRTG